MDKEKLTFSLTGNFQYDLGILGLKKVLDFFEFEYENDEYSITVDRDKNLLLEDIIAKLIIDNGIDYFYEKVIEELKKRENNKESNHKNSSKKKKIKTNKKIEKINPMCNKDCLKIEYKNNDLEKLIKKISEEIYKTIYDKKYEYNIIKDIVWQKGVNLLNNILLNFQADMKAIGEHTLLKANDKLKKDIIPNSKCSFCNKREGKRISRDVFFFAPAQYNAFWFNEPTLYICPECLVTNLAITQSFIFLGNKLETLVCYIPNILDMEKLNDSLKIHFNENLFFGKIIKPIIDYQKELLKKEASIKELQILNFRLDSKNPLMDLFILSENSIKKLIKIENELVLLFDKNVINMLFGYVREGNIYVRIDLSKELLRSISENIKIFYLVQRYSKYCIMSEIFRQNRTKNPPIKNFNPKIFLNFLKIHFKLEGYMINEFESFQDLGQRIRQRIYMILTNNGAKAINWNTFDNKLISLSNSFLNVSRTSLQQFQELLARTIISIGLNPNIDIIKSINRTNFSEIATTIALSVLVSGTNEQRETTDKNIIDESSPEEQI